MPHEPTLREVTRAQLVEDAAKGLASRVGGAVLVMVALRGEERAVGVTVAGLEGDDVATRVCITAAELLVDAMQCVIEGGSEATL